MESHDGPIWIELGQIVNRPTVRGSGMIRMIYVYLKSGMPLLKVTVDGKRLYGPIWPCRTKSRTRGSNRFGAYVKNVRKEKALDALNINHRTHQSRHAKQQNDPWNSTYSRAHPESNWSQKITNDHDSKYYWLLFMLQINILSVWYCFCFK